MLDRRTFIGGVVCGLLAAPLAAESQSQAGKLPRIGVLTSGPMTAVLQEAFRQGLRDHSYVEGQNILIEWRAAE
jgi:putative ABC transport system substrate-binding protein